MSHVISQVACELAAELDGRFGQDSEQAKRLAGAQHRLQHANDRLWSGLHPDGLISVYGEDPAEFQLASAEERSEVLGAQDPLQAARQAHWQIHSAFIDYQTAAEERRQLAADTGEMIRRFVDELVVGGWSEQQARNANVRELAGSRKPTHP
jgi:hypothetical protein